MDDIAQQVRSEAIRFIMPTITDMARQGRTADEIVHVLAEIADPLKQWCEAKRELLECMDSMDLDQVPN